LEAGDGTREGESGSDPPPFIKERGLGVLRAYRFVLLACGYMFGIYVVSSLPGESTERLMWLPDYVFHALGYAVLAALWFIALRRTWDLSVRKAVVWTMLIALLYGVLDEIHQSFTPGRVPSSADVVADVLGAAIALLLMGLRPVRRALHI